MTAAWPPDLPCPSRIGYQLAYGEGRLRKDSERGPPGYRRRFSSVPKSATMTIVLTRAQYATFENFFDVTLKGGSLPFTMVDVLKDGAPLLDEFGDPVLDAVTGLPVLEAVTNICLFGDDLPKVTGSSRRITVTFTLIQMP